jgi:hypothetical protein
MGGVMPTEGEAFLVFMFAAIAGTVVAVAIIVAVFRIARRTEECAILLRTIVAAMNVDPAIVGDLNSKLRQWWRTYDKNRPVQANVK